MQTHQGSERVDQTETETGRIRAMSDNLVKSLRTSWDGDRSIISQTDKWMKERKEAADRIEELEANLEKAVEALEKISSMACMGTGIALGRDIFRDTSSGYPWADELSARIELANTTLAELKTQE
jgi:hypothetical protein